MPAVFCFVRFLYPENPAWASGGGMERETRNLLLARGAMAYNTWQQ